jgi:hypothetical protein
MHKSMDDQLGMPTESLEASMMQPHTTSNSDLDLHTVPPILTDTSADETCTTPATPGVHVEGGPALATAEGSLLLRSANSAHQLMSYA